MLASSIVRHRPVRDYSCCVLDSAFCFRDSSLPAPFVMPSRRNIFNPAEAYVMTLGDGQSKKRVIQLLNQISRFFGAADLHTMEWHMLTYDHVLALRETRVRSGLSPATINLQLSVIKMTCKQCWLKNLMPLQTYAAIKEVKSVRGGRVSKGRALKPAESGRLLKTTEADGDIRSKRDAAIIALALGCAGCARRQTVTVYRIAKEGAALLQTETITVPDGTDPVQVMIDALGAAPGDSTCFNPVRGWLTLGGYRIDDAGTLWLTVTSSDTASGIARTQALACLVLSGTALDGVSAVGLEDTDGDALYAPLTANDLALTDPATDAQS